MSHFVLDCHLISREQKYKTDFTEDFMNSGVMRIFYTIWEYQWTMKRYAVVSVCICAFSDYLSYFLDLEMQAIHDTGDRVQRGHVTHWCIVTRKRHTFRESIRYNWSIHCLQIYTISIKQNWIKVFPKQNKLVEKGNLLMLLLRESVLLGDAGGVWNV